MTRQTWGQVLFHRVTKLGEIQQYVLTSTINRRTDFSVLASQQLQHQQSWLAVFLASLLPRVTWIPPTFVSLNIRIASEWVNPATDRPFTENISSPGKQFLMRMSVGGKYGQQNPLTDGQTLNDPSFETESIPHPI